MGFRHYLKGNAKCEQPSLLAFLATASMPEQDRVHHRRQWHHLRCGALITMRWDGKTASRRKVHTFGTATEWWQIVETFLSRKKVAWIYAHGWHRQATLLDVWGLIESGVIRLHRVSRDGKCRCNNGEPGPRCWKGFVNCNSLPWLCSGETNRGRLNLVDCLNYSRYNIANLGSNLNLYQHIYPDANAGDNVWRAFCTREAEIVERFIAGLMAEWKAADSGNWKMTAAGLSYTNWRHKFMPAGIVIDTDREARELERDGYYGGQISCWYRGEVVDDSDPVAEAIHTKLDLRTHCLREPVYELDVTSLYPSIMARNLYPCKLVGVLRFPSLEDLCKLSEEYSCIASVTVRAMHEGYPCRSGDSLLFPEGVYQTTLCQPELRRAIERNHVVSCHRIAMYETADLFTAFVKHWWGKRRRAKLSHNIVREELCKMMMNCLGGKFGQRKSVWRPRPELTPPDRWCLWAGPRRNGRGLVRHRSVGWNDYELVGEEYGDDAFPAVSAFITSYGREYMRAVRAQLPVFSCLYQHTDSIVVTQKGLDVINSLGLVRENQLGLFKLPVKITHAVFRGPNNVTVNQTDKVSGVGEGAHKLDDGRWVVNRVEPFSNFFARKPDGTLAVDKQELYKPVMHVGMHEWTPGWWNYSPRGL